MTVPMVLLPLFVQVGLTFVLFFWMAGARFGALRRREVRIPDIALGQPAWPPYAMQVANAFRNQFELPVLFYVLVVLALFTRKTDTLFVVLSSMFVASRLAHAAIHATSNDVRRRFLAFAVGGIVLLVMWIVFAARILLGI